mmetsp:Transcript_34394/g.31104  ORF Transcript_34394/g.31104 Transcript_34394/m.31104 type:complete len:86 (+) Transcript_34394:1145-1402(+)|eukprot:CAMPEP_0114587252 /NCGR_PEP_ID=MMETSP0125-20121206/10261_1 /TAXON_ID=485358 ORGANISM="Aristerostoma sp., Strain ATCC 50986" /NCGR_SAMPLE_ID=MMETSP0125 /ASSEMBLY_ACC=CAM_ASM_000245 /LENGTH=85 /DNA_ID=CAMNT_0001783075 /DNA_START=1100 /DNA_END=1357 /DNA_ORIENTATION=-
MYGKLEETSEMNKGGIGLGLTICKMLHAKLCPDGSQIEVESEVGKGTKFSFRLPVWISDEEEQDTIVIEGLNASHDVELDIVNED